MELDKTTECQRSKRVKHTKMTSYNKSSLFLLKSADGVSDVECKLHYKTNTHKITFMH